MIQFQKILRAGSAITSILFGAALMTIPSAPVAAQSVFIGQGVPYGVSQPQNVSSFIYGSPIPTPMPVDPVTGISVRRAPINSWSSTPTRRTGTVVNSTLINPVLVNPKIQDSTLINPVILDSGYRRFNRVPSGVIFVP
ncbi:hypothetical protein Glo7428_2923 [Gloeocapsa sp. PCC 7428]|uniref:hypothetical protein n=1 Tax=Gloeocapsa sp. PCC 7428 TaxID=1173026 RepID=UPI0002A5C257|nr:hypothetical protein [Gloeocapsa sp. PCC 7428]AFZ31418.1 hypothetical protein Glo7428_2923 [Gloeocapsa sp. PCC 7428]